MQWNLGGRKRPEGAVSLDIPRYSNSCFFSSLCFFPSNYQSEAFLSIKSLVLGWVVLFLFESPRSFFNEGLN